MQAANHQVQHRQAVAAVANIGGIVSRAFVFTGTERRGFRVELPLKVIFFETQAADYLVGGLTPAATKPGITGAISRDVEAAVQAVIHNFTAL